MDPVAFNLFGMEVRWYGVIISAAMIIGVLLAIRNGKKEGFVEDHILDVSLLALPLAVIGARLYYVIFNLELYQDNWLSMFNTRMGGMAIHGGLIGGILGGLIICFKRKMNVLKVADIVAPSVILGQAIGRWGNFINQEAHGGPTNLPWGIMVDGVKVHPTFLYESIWNLIIFVFLMKIFKNKKFDWQMASIYLIGYSIGRFFIEGLRTDSLMFGSFRVAQLISTLMIASGILLYNLLKNKKIGPAYREN